MSVTRIDVVPPDFSSTASGATNTLSGNAAVNCAVVSAVSPSTVAVIRATPVVVLMTLARAMLLPSASIATGVICPSVVRNATVRRPAGRSGATVEVTTTGVTPSADPEDGATDTVMMFAGLTEVNTMVNSYGRSRAVTRTRAGPMVLSL